MALLAMVVYSTEENGKDEYLEKSLSSLKETVDFKKHRIVFSVNGYTKKTLKLLSEFKNIFPLNCVTIYNTGNIGTANAINKAWTTRFPNENCIKVDDDVIYHHKDWVYLMEEAIRREPKIGQIGLKRRDLAECPSNPDPFYKSEIRMLPHQPGEKWITVEYVQHVMGTAVCHSAALIDKIGGLVQPGLYGFDDSLMSYRAHLAGFNTAFLVGVDIEHIDRGDTPFQTWKQKSSGADMNKYNQMKADYSSGKLKLYHEL